MNKFKFLNTVKILLPMFGLAIYQAAVAQEVQVLAADPSTAEQGTVSLDITIAGAGFDNSAKVFFLVTRTENPGGITVNNTKVRGPKKIIANIDVSETAVVDDFDIVVQMSRGRGGKGTTLFSVLKKPGGGNDYTTGCLEYSDRDLIDEIQSDDFVPKLYCHGTDGQISVPRLLRHDLKKFNGNGRTIIVDPYCHDTGAICFRNPAEARILQSRGEGDSAGNWAGNDLSFPAMGYLEVSRVSLDFDLGKQRHIYFGNGSFVDDATQACGPVTETEARAAWIRCEAVDGDTCTEWTVSSDDLRDPTADGYPDNARACLVHWKGNAPIIDGNVEADFEIHLFEQ
jgi:hypothetical protein